MTAVDSVSFDVNAGEVFGLLGPNGAGKTTTLRILATLIEATSGTATVDGLDVRKDAMAVRRKIGVVNGGMGLYDRLKGREILHYFGKLYGMTAAQVEARTEQLDELLAEGRALADFEERKAVYQEAEKLIAEEAPLIFIATRTGHFATSAGVSGFAPSESQTWLTLPETTVGE